MSVGNWFTGLRTRLEQSLQGKEAWWNCSPALYVMRNSLVPVLQEHVNGRVLDVGCGRIPYRKYLTDQIESYDGFDVERRSEETRFLGDAHDLSSLADDSYDTVVSFSVVEHLRRPWEAVSEMARVCAPGGTVILEVPHLSRYHELPHDYYRFTAFGLDELATLAGLEPVEIQAAGGLFAFLGHQVSTVFLTLAWPVPVIRWGAFAVNYLCCVRLCLLLDRLLGTTSAFPMSLVGVYSRPQRDE